MYAYKSLFNELDSSAEYLSVDNLVVRSLDPNSLTYASQDRQLRSLPLGPGQLPIGRLNETPIANYLEGTTNQIAVTSTSGNIKLSLPQDIAPTSSPSFEFQTLTHVLRF